MQHVCRYKIKYNSYMHTYIYWFMPTIYTCFNKAYFVLPKHDTMQALIAGMRYIYGYRAT